MEPPKPPPRDSERRFATVVFADISGFTSLSEQLDPEDMTEITNRCFEVLESAVRTHGGHVDKYMGDCIMALFGVPQTLERAPVLAVHAAVEMMARLPAALRAHAIPVPLDLHVGINSGLVFAGEVGGATKHDFTVMGDTVNLAQRLKDAAPRGAIWVGPLTYRYTKDDFDYEALKPQAVKGKVETVAAYRVVGVRRRAGAARPGPTDGMVSSGLVGRELELATLERAIAEVRVGRGGIVSVLGEAGIGKSRVVAEALQADATAGVLVLRGAAIAVGQTLRYHPFVELLRTWSGIVDGDADADAVGKLAAAVGAVAPDEVSELVPFLATVLGVRLTGEHEARLHGIEGEGLEKLIHKSMRDLLQRLAASQPVVVVLEDVHWADGSSIDLLETLLRLVDETRVLFVHALRPEHPGPGRRALVTVRQRYGARHVEIALEPLTAKQGDRLIRNLLRVDDLPHAAVASMLRKADGNPFFLEEVARSLIEEGAIVDRDGRSAATERLAHIVIPETVQEIILSRMDRLPEQVRRPLQIAAVIGRSFRPRVLAAVLSSERELEWALGYLRKRQLVVQRVVDDGVEYVFKHALGQETIYGAIPKSTRRTLHGAVARAIEALFADRLPEFYGMLAYHYSRAEDRDRAEEYLFKAGDEAARSAASSEALEYFQQASQLYFEIHGNGGDPGKKALLETNIGTALMNTGRLTEAVPHFNEALRHLGEPPLTSPTRLVVRGALDLLAVVLHLYFPHRRAPRAREPARLRNAIQVRYQRAKAQTTTDTTRFFFDTIGSIRQLSRTDPRTVPGASGMYAGGAALFSFSGVSSSIGARFLAIAGRLAEEGDIGDEIAYRSMRFIHHYLAGDWDSRHLMESRVLEEGLRYGQLWDASAYLGLCAERSLRQGRFSEAEALIARLAAIADGYSSDFARSNHDGEWATLLIEQRRLDSALAAIHHYATSRFEPLFNLLALGWEAKVRQLRGDAERAAAVLAEGERALRALGQVPPYHRSAFILSRLRFDVGAVEAALAAGERRSATTLVKRATRSARSAIRNARRVSVDRVETYRLVGRLQLLRGRRSSARRWWERSLAESRRLEATPEGARTHREIAERMPDATKSIAGLTPAQHGEQARAVFTSLGLSWDIARMDGPTEPEHSLDPARAAR